MQRKNHIAVLIGIVALAGLFAAGCTQAPTGAYDVNEGASGDWGVATLTTDPAGNITGVWNTAELCYDHVFDIEGIKGPSDIYEEEVFLLATAPEGAIDQCFWMKEKICFFLDDTSEAGDFASMGGRWADCTNFPFVDFSLGDLPGGDQAFVLVAPLPE
jgi:hypothetical protein